MKKVLISGATSFIGYEVVKEAIRTGWNVIAVVRRNGTKSQKLQGISNVEIVELNMDEYDKLGSMVGDVDCFVHLAWNGTRGADRNDEELQRSNYLNSMAAITSVLNAGCRKILTAGSQAEYGVHQGIITEETTCQPNTEYGKYKYKLYCEVSKICAEKQAIYIEPRIFSIYGPGDYEHTLIMDLIRKMQRKEPCNMTAGIQNWDYLYVGDAAKAIMTLCERDCESGAYNLASGDVRTLRDYVEELKYILISNSQLNFGAVPYPSTGAVSIEPDICRIKRLGWTATTKFRDGVEKLISESIFDIT